MPAERREELQLTTQPACTMGLTELIPWLYIISNISRYFKKAVIPSAQQYKMFGDLSREVFCAFNAPCKKVRMCKEVVRN